MELETFIYMVIGAVAGGVAFIVFESTAMVTASIAFVTVVWILMRFTSGKLLWDTGKFLINPATMLLLGMGLGVTYLSLELGDTVDSMTGGLGVAFLGAALGMLLYKYWNIGS